MIDLNKLKRCIDLNNPNKALEYLENNMTKHEMYMYIINKVISQKNNNCIYIPLPTVYNTFMSFIQDKCNEPYMLIEDITYKKEQIDIEISDELKNIKLQYLDDFRKNFIGTKFERYWIILFVQYILYLNKGTSKKIELLSPFYSIKNGCLLSMFVYKFNLINDFKFADER